MGTARGRTHRGDRHPSSVVGTLGPVGSMYCLQHSLSPTQSTLEEERPPGAMDATDCTLTHYCQLATVLIVSGSIVKIVQLLATLLLYSARLSFICSASACLKNSSKPARLPNI